MNVQGTSEKTADFVAQQKDQCAQNPENVNSNRIWGYIEWSELSDQDFNTILGEQRTTYLNSPIPYQYFPYKNTCEITLSHVKQLFSHVELTFSHVKTRDMR